MAITQEAPTMSAAMQTTLTAAEATPAEQRVIFHNLSWQAYQQILAALGESRSSRLTYDGGSLEITMPLEEHEVAVRLLELFIRILVEEIGLKIKTMGSTTLNRADLEKSAEPDNCYYIQNQSKVAGKKVNLSEDPPPDLIVEVDITHTDINKLNPQRLKSASEAIEGDSDIVNFFVQAGDAIAIVKRISVSTGNALNTLLHTEVHITLMS
jgi:Uma2 family endonuclease